MFSYFSVPCRALSDDSVASHSPQWQRNRPYPLLNLHHRFDRRPLVFANLLAHSPPMALAAGRKKIVHDCAPHPVYIICCTWLRGAESREAELPDFLGKIVPQSPPIIPCIPSDEKNILWVLHFVPPYPDIFALLGSDLVYTKLLGYYMQWLMLFNQLPHSDPFLLEPNIHVSTQNTPSHYPKNLFTYFILH